MGLAATLIAAAMFTGCKSNEPGITKVTLNSTAETVNVGSTTTLTYTIEPTGAKVESAVWSSSADFVATVDQNGVVKGVGAGVATITITVNGKYTATCAVTVEAGNPYLEILAMGEYIGMSNEDVRMSLALEGWSEVDTSLTFNKTINENNVTLQEASNDNVNCDEICVYITDTKYHEYAKGLVVAVTDSYKFETLGKTVPFNEFSGEISEDNYDETNSYTEAVDWLNTRTYTNFRCVWFSTTSTQDYDGLMIMTDPDNTQILVALGSLS